jgi:hypothetical protein
LTTTDSLIADLEAGLAAAKALAGADIASQDTAVEPEPTGSMMPGGVDSAPVSAVEPATPAKATTVVEADVADVERAAETEGLDLVHELREGKPVKELAHLLGGSAGAVESIVQAISDIAQGVRI